MIRFAHITIGVIVLLTLCVVAPAVERFPPPEFESGYQRPSPAVPGPRQDIYEYVDAASACGGDWTVFISGPEETKPAGYIYSDGVFFALFRLLAKGVRLFSRGDSEYYSVDF